MVRPRTWLQKNVRGRWLEIFCQIIGSLGSLAGVEALHFADFQFSFEFDRNTPAVGSNPGVHIVGSFFASIAGEGETDSAHYLCRYILW